MSYKGLKKIINELSSPLTPGLNPSEAAKQRLQTVKAAFFFQVDRELEKVNLFYLQKEADAKVRLRSLIEKQRTLQSRGPRNRTATIRALHEAFLNSRHDLDKLQNFVEINGTGFRKILKKWDKRSKSSTKELYLARQVEVQPCFNQDVIAELSDAVTKCLSELEHALEVEETDLVISTAMATQFDLTLPSSLQETLSTPASQAAPANTTADIQHFSREYDQNLVATYGAQDTNNSKPTSTSQPSFGVRHSSTGFLFDPSLTDSFQIDRIEAELFQALLKVSTQAAEALLNDYKAQKSTIKETCVTRMLWRACSEIKAPEKQKLLLDSGLADLRSTDDINERTLVHEAAVHGSLAVLEAAVAAGCDANEPDYYGRRAIHYAAINGHEQCIRYLLELGCSVSAIDDDGNSAFEYAIINSNAEVAKLLLQADPTVANSTPEHPMLVLACEKGHKDIVFLLLESNAEMTTNIQGIHPIHVAARSGYVEILRLLLQHSAPVDVVDKDLGWTPIFYAASEGHAEIIRILLEAGANAKAVDEVGHTPAYYASYEGHSNCADVLLEAKPKKTESNDDRGTSDIRKPNDGDENRLNSAPSASVDAESLHVISNSNTERQGSTTAPSGEPDEVDLDGIPSLSLPPPLIPFRIYGHNFLGKRTRIQIRIQADSRTGDSPISFFDDRDTFSLKLVAIAKPDSGMVPHTIMLPLETPNATFGFLTDDPSQFRIEFMLYPSFGLQPIGKAVALPSLFKSADRGIARLPFLDRYLKLVAEVKFEYLIIRSFAEAQLQIGGKVETYWKSTNPGPRSNTTSASTSILASGFTTQSPKAPLVPGISNTPLSVAAIGSPLSIADSMGGNQGASPVPLVIASSLAAEHVCVQVQVCKDGVPVVTPRLQINSCGPNSLKIQVTSLTHSEFQSIVRPRQSDVPNSSTTATSDRLSLPHGLNTDPKPDATTGTAVEWYRYILDRGLTLKEVLGILPTRFGISIQVLYRDCELNIDGDSMSKFTRCDTDVNDYVDAILRTVYADLQKNLGTSHSSDDGRTADQASDDRCRKTDSQRNTIFCSYSPAVCNALNWKQPNYPVFLLTSGRERGGLDSAAAGSELKSEEESGVALDFADAPSARPTLCHLSLKEAIRFACANNLLGIMCSASLLTRVPELVKNIKGSGLFLVSFGRDNQDEQSCVSQKANGVDAIMKDGVIKYETDETTEYAI
ncbi:phosphate system positive regulatory protein pho81 [Coemansia sp. RSA 1646]|nr:phosphate system positive regulatory protein pho81 [Coemansia sp. RSA 1646]KAJ2089425.1 phosphate system positive regulatory protein pho81 [Coemansia sp. RSA 986]